MFERPLEPLSFDQVQVTGAVQNLSPPKGASYAYIQSQGGALRWSDISTPSGSSGLIVANGDTLFYSGSQLNQFRFILKTSEPTTYLAVIYYKVA